METPHIIIVGWDVMLVAFAERISCRQVDLHTNEIVREIIRL